jgi:type IV pilus assembly protein PilQ
VVIGGLIKNQLDNNGTQIPTLGSLPGVGALFRKKTEKTNRSEIIVLITPRIVHQPELTRESNLEAMEFHHRQAVYAEQMSPFSKVHLSAKYLYEAQQAWAANQQPRAMRLVNLSIHFNPLNRAAIDLRSDIAAGVHVGDHTGQAPYLPPASQHPLDGSELAPWILNDLEPVARPEPEPVPSKPKPTSRRDNARAGGS